MSTVASQRVSKISPIEQFVSQLAVKAFDIAILPGAAGFNEQGLYPHTAQPLTDRLRRELRAVIRPNMFARAMFADRNSRDESDDSVL